MVPTGGAEMFERRHMVRVILYLYRRGGSATRMEIYNDVANNDHMPDKFEVLEEAGLIVQTRDRFTRAVTLTLTPEGERAAACLEELDSIVGGARGNVEDNGARVPDSADSAM